MAPKKSRRVIIDDDDDSDCHVQERRVVDLLNDSDDEADRNTNNDPPRSGDDIREVRRRISPAKHWCFTWNNPPVNALDSWTQMSIIEKLCAQEEIGASGTPHVQGYVMFTEKVRPMSVFPSNQDIHWELCRNVDASITYCTKEETRTPNGRQWIVGMTVKSQIPVITPRGWQKTLIERIPTMESRKVYWYYEPDGNVGKSAICKYLCVRHDALLISGKGSDVKSAIHSMKNKPKLILMDIPRSSEKYVSYATLEEVSNGCFFSGKYEGGMVLMEEPVLVCFANAEPDYGMMSVDRWEVTRICT